MTSLSGMISHPNFGKQPPEDGLLSLYIKDEGPPGGYYPVQLLGNKMLRIVLTIDEDLWHIFPSKKAKYTVHRDLLCSHSRYFDRMFKELHERRVRQVTEPVITGSEGFNTSGGVKDNKLLNSECNLDSYIPSALELVTHWAQYEKRNNDDPDNDETLDIVEYRQMIFDGMNLYAFENLISWLYTQRIEKHTAKTSDDIVTLFTYIYILAQRFEIADLESQCYRRIFQECKVGINYRNADYFIPSLRTAVYARKDAKIMALFGMNIAFSIWKDVAKDHAFQILDHVPELRGEVGQLLLAAHQKGWFPNFLDWLVPKEADEVNRSDNLNGNEQHAWCKGSRPETENKQQNEDENGNVSMLDTEELSSEYGKDEMDNDTDKGTANVQLSPSNTAAASLTGRASSNHTTGKRIRGQVMHQLSRLKREPEKAVHSREKDEWDIDLDEVYGQNTELVQMSVDHDREDANSDNEETDGGVKVDTSDEEEEDEGDEDTDGGVELDTGDDDEEGIGDEVNVEAVDEDECVGGDDETGDDEEEGAGDDGPDDDQSTTTDECEDDVEAETDGDSDTVSDDGSDMAIEEAMDMAG